MYHFSLPSAEDSSVPPSNAGDATKIDDVEKSTENRIHPLIAQVIAPVRTLSSQSLTASRPASVTRQSTNVCHYFKEKGWCKFGNACRYSHEVSVPRKAKDRTAAPQESAAICLLLQRCARGGHGAPHAQRSPLQKCPVLWCCYCLCIAVMPEYLGCHAIMAHSMLCIV